MPDTLPAPGGLVIPLLTSLQFGGRDWLLPAIALFLLALVTIWLAYRDLRHIPRRTLTLCIAIKSFGFLLLALCLLDPELVRQSQEEEKESGIFHVTMLYDNSLSLTVTDKASSQSRGEALRNALRDAPFRDKLAQTFELREYLVDTRLRRGTPADLDFNGTASDLARGLQSITRRTRAGTLSAIVLFTDGNCTDRELVDLSPEVLAEFPPIYPVALGTDTPAPDIALDRVESTRSAFEEAPVRLRADIVAHGASGQTVHAILYDPQGVEVGRESVVLSDDRERVAVRFNHRPVAPGPAFYRIALEAPDLEEQLTGNNERHVAVHRDTGPYRVLYVSGRPNWEFKFLHRALAPDREVELVGLIRLAKREPKFAFRGRSGETSNPLFRGFNNADEEDGFDQPVLQRLYTKDETELAGGFPKSAAELFAYDALILDDIEAAFFTQDQMDLIDAFVSKRGGGLLMLGGQECFTHGGYAQTPLADLLPVYVNANAPSRDLPATTKLRLDFTREGWLQPWIRLRETEAAERQRLSRMTSFTALNRVPGIKPGASVLASVSTDSSTRHPAFVAQRYGRGQVGAMLLADLWRWGFKHPDQKEDMQKAWRQTVRWLVSDIPRRANLHAKRAPNTVTLTADLLDETFTPHVEASATVRITPPSGEVLTLDTTPSDETVGRAIVSLKPKKTGTYLAELEALDAQGKPIGTAATGWALNPAAEELRTIVPDHGWLTQLAEATGGEVLQANDLDALPDRIQHPTRTVEVTKVVKLWHLPIVFLAALLCFLLEWWIRRERGLA